MLSQNFVHHNTRTLRDHWGTGYVNRSGIPGWLIVKAWAIRDKKTFTSTFLPGAPFEYRCIMYTRNIVTTVYIVAYMSQWTTSNITYFIPKPNPAQADVFLLHIFALQPLPFLKIVTHGHNCWIRLKWHIVSSGDFNHVVLNQHLRWRLCAHLYQHLYSIYNVYLTINHEVQFILRERYG